MDLEKEIKKYVELKRIGQTNPTFNGSEIQKNEFESLHRDLYGLYVHIILPEYGNKFNSFNEWIDYEYNQLLAVDNLSKEANKLLKQTSALDEHMKSFDNLGFNNEKVYNWRKSILKTLEDNDYEMSGFYFSSFNTNNKELLQHIALKENTYNFLNSKGLINTGFCPMTGERINNTFNFKLYNRVVYLSKKGVEVCENINRKEWNKNQGSMDYDTFQKLKKQQSSSCYIATACYGSVYACEVDRFREYRDGYLITSWLGRAFIAFYYFTSPPIAKVIEKHEWMKKTIRRFLLSPILKRLPKN